MIGLVYYGDDPHRRVFRTVYPQPGDPTDILDDPRWVTEGVDQSRPVLIDKVAASSGRKRGTPWTPASEPVVYLINLETLNSAQQDAAWAFIATGPTWLNVISLGAGDAQTLLAGVTLLSPCWVCVIDGDPGLGAAARQRTSQGHTVGVWVI